MRTVEKHRAMHWTAAVAAALALHGAALWALQIERMRRAADVPPVPVAPVIEMVVSRADPVRLPVVAPSPPVARPVKAKVQSQPKPKAKARTTAALPPSHAPLIQPSPVSERLVETPQPVPDSVTRTAHEAVPTAPAQPASDASTDVARTDGRLTGAASAAVAAGQSAQQQGNVVLPSEKAGYLNNPPPEYPPLSVLRHESGTVVVRVLIGVDGRAHKARIATSSGYDRLDDAALTTARDRWRYRPGTRGGVPEAMWYDVPIRFNPP